MSIFAINLSPFLKSLSFKYVLTLPDWSEPTPAQLDAVDSYNAYCHAGEGFDFFEQGAYEFSIALFSEAIRLDETCLPAAIGRALALFQMSSFAKAYDDFDHISALAPENALAPLGRALTDMTLGREEAALIECQRSIDLAPQVCAPQNAFAAILAASGDLKGALEKLNMPVNLAEDGRDTASVLVNRSTIFYALGLWEQAARDMDKAIKLYPEMEPHAPLFLWCCRARAGDRRGGDEALADYLSPLSAARRSHWPWFTAFAWFLLGCMASSSVHQMVTAFEGRQKTEHLREFHFYQACLALLEGQEETAIEHYEQCIAVKDNMSREYVCAKEELRRLKKSVPEA